jgi:uncharacterized membrane protein
VQFHFILFGGGGGGSGIFGILARLFATVFSRVESLRVSVSPSFSLLLADLSLYPDFSRCVRDDTTVFN